MNEDKVGEVLRDLYRIGICDAVGQYPGTYDEEEMEVAVGEAYEEMTAILAKCITTENLWKMLRKEAV